MEPLELEDFRDLYRNANTLVLFRGDGICPKLKKNISGYKVGFVIHEGFAPFPPPATITTQAIQSRPYHIEPVLIRLEIKKNTRITFHNTIVRENVYHSPPWCDTPFVVDDHEILKIRCSRAHVAGIYKLYHHYSYRGIANNLEGARLPDDTIVHSFYDASFIYYTGKVITPKRPFDDRDEIDSNCSSGIHFFTTPKQAYDYCYHWDIGGMRSYWRDGVNYSRLERFYENDKKIKERIKNG